MDQRKRTVKCRIGILWLMLLSIGISQKSIAQAISFGSTGLVGESVNNPTSLDFGPDGRLYVSQQNGTIYAYTVERDNAAPGSGTYSVTDTEIISLVKNATPNHNDDGTQNSTQTRQITGLMVIGTAANPVIYVTSSDWRISVGNDTGLDTNSGVISRLTWNGSNWVKVDIVRGFPRCEENHSINGMDLDEATNTLYVAIGGNTNKGAPGNNFSGTPEYFFSGTIITVNLNQINGMPVYTDARTNTQFVYDLPTLDDPTRSNITNADAGFPYPSGHPLYNASIDIGDPFGGNNGLNMAFPETGGPVQIYSPGYRNPYDVVLTSQGRIYTQDNGPNGGWGGQPLVYDAAGNLYGGNLEALGNTAAEIDAALGTEWYLTNEFNESGSTTIGDILHYVDVPGYYGGHPTPIRAFPEKSGIYVYEEISGVWQQIGPRYEFGDLLAGVQGYFQTSFSITDFPANPDEAPYIGAELVGNRLAIESASTNGICEYTASNFNNQLQGDILSASYNGNINRYKLNSDGNQATIDEVLFSGFGSQPLDVIAQGDGDPFPGTVWACTYGSDNITIFEPADFGSCPQPGDADFVGTDDSDLDGYTNQDEVDNGTNHCSGGSTPSDNDGDFISDLNDPDDDNDGILDVNDAFALDPDNGLNTVLPVTYPFWNNDPGTGLFGLGFTGLMINNATDWLDQYDENFLAAGGATGKLGVEKITAGDALGANNNQDNAFQFGVNNGPDKFTVQSKLEEPFFAVNGSPSTPVDFQSYGIYIGTGDQDNYLKVVFSAQGGNGGIQVLKEVGGTVTQDDAYDNTVVGDILNATSVVLYLSCDPATNTVQPYVSIDDGINLITLGAPVDVPASWLDPADSQALAVGVIGTSRGSGIDFAGTWDFMNVSEDQPASLSALTDPVNFGQAISGSGAVTQDLRVTNLGGPVSGAVEITAINFTGSDAAEFSYNGSLPLIIGPGNLQDIPITFTPGAVGVKSASIELVHTGDNSPTLVGVQAEVIENLVVLYRVNAGGANLSALDAPNPDWDTDTNTNPSPYRNSGSSVANTSPNSIDASVPASTPTGVWSQERWDPATGSEMEWDFPAPVSGPYIVRLYFLNNCSCTDLPGERIFDVNIEGVTLLDNFDIVALYGHKVAVMEEFNVSVTDGNLDIDFIHVVENPLINAIEILGPVQGDPPLLLDPIADQTNVVGETVNLPDLVNASGGNPGENFDYSATGLPLGLQIEPSSGNIFGVVDANADTGGPNNDGIHPVTITVDKPSADPVSTSFTWTIFSSLPITIDPIANQVNTAGDLIDPPLQVNAAGGTTGESFTYSATGLPTGLQIDAATGAISGTIDANAFSGGPGGDGVFSVTVTADKPSDDPASTSFTWTILDPNATNTVLHRVNAGGAAVAANDAPNPDWDVDTQANPSPYVNSGAQNVTFSASVTLTNNTGYPNALFLTERYNTNTGTTNNMQWDFPLPAGNYTVNLLFAEIFSGAASIGARVFDVEIEGSMLLDNYDAFADAGFATAVVKSFPVTVSDGNLDINFIKINENPAIKGIEILAAGNVSNFPPVVDAIPDQTNQEGDAVSLQVVATDGDGGTQTLTYEATGLPAGLTIDGNTGLISGTVAADAHTGSPYSVEVTVTDNGDPVLSSSVSFQWTVPDPNQTLWVDKPTPTNYTGRHECSFVQAGEHFFLFGGREMSQTLDVYDYQNNTWSQAANQAPLPFNHFQAVEYQGLIWVIGAFKTNSFPTETPADHIYMYNPATDTWTQGAAIPAGPGVDEDRRRGSAGLVLYNDKFYVVSGIKNGHTDGWVPYFDEYDPATNTWTVLPDLPQARDHFHAAVIGDKLYVAGGRRSGEINTFAPLVPEVDVYDFTSGTWSTLPAASNLPTPRAACGTAVHEGELYIIGGEGNGQAWTTTEALDVNTNTWSTKDELNHARHGFQAITSGDGIYVVAGSPAQGGGNQQNMEYYGTDNATGTPLDPSELSAPASVNFAANASEIVTLLSQNGNQGIIVNSLAITGANAADFSFVTGNFGQFLIPAGGSHQIEIAFNSDQPDKTAVLEIEYVGGATIFVDLLGPVSTNNPPVVTAPGDQTSTEGDLVSLLITADDGDGGGQVLTYTASNLPPGLSIDQSTGEISGTVAAGAAANSPYAVSVTVTDDGSPVLSETVNFSWTVLPAATGDIVFASSISSACEGRNVTVSLYDATDNSLVISQTMQVAADGSFTMSGVSAGTYDIFVKVDYHLQKGLPDQTIVTGVNNIDVGALAGGDSNNDNLVNFLDFLVLSGAYNTSLGDPGYDATADYNCDDVVNFLDFLALSANYNVSGDEPNP